MKREEEVLGSEAPQIFVDGASNEGTAGDGAEEPS